MSHPYSGSASYIYANEYRTPTQPNFGIKPLPPTTTKSYNYYHPQQPVEINLRVRPDAGDISLDAGGYGRTRAGMLKPTAPPTSSSFSPSSQVSSLPTSHGTHTHSRSHSSNQHQHSIGMHSRDGSSSHQHQHQNDTRTYAHISTPSPHPYNTTTATTASPGELNSYNDPFAYHPRTHRYHREHDQHIPPLSNSYSHSYPLTEEKPKPKLKLKSKFKLTLPNPFHFLDCTSSSHKQRSPLSVWSPSLTGPTSRRFRSPTSTLPPLPLNRNSTSTSNTPHSSSGYYYANMFDNSTNFTTDSPYDYPAPNTATTTTMFSDTDYANDDPSSSGWRWSNPTSQSSKSHLSRWLSKNSTVRTKSSSGTFKSKSSTSSKTKQMHAKSTSKSYSTMNALPTVVEHNITNLVGRDGAGDGHYAGYNGGYGDGYNGGVSGTLPRRAATTIAMTMGISGTTTTGISGSSAVPAGTESGSVTVDQRRTESVVPGDNAGANANVNGNVNVKAKTQSQFVNIVQDPNNHTESNTNVNPGTETHTSTSTSAGGGGGGSGGGRTEKRNRSLRLAQQASTRVVVGTGRRAERDLNFAIVSA